MIIPKETDADNRILKYKRMIRKCALNIQVWLENNSNPTEEDMVMLKALQAKLRDSILYYEDHTFSLIYCGNIFFLCCQLGRVLHPYLLQTNFFVCI